MLHFCLRLAIFSVLFHVVTLKEPFAVDKLSVRSPLDKDTLSGKEGIKNRAEDEGTSFPEMLQQNGEVLTVKGVHVPDCARGCTQQLFSTFDVAFRGGNNFERFINVCDRFNETIICLTNLEHCGSLEVFNTISSGLKYMCIEQREAFTTVVECIDANTASVKDSCTKSCNAHGIVTGWALYAALRDTMVFTPQIGNTPSKVNPAFFRKMTGEGCGVFQCYLSCLRTTYNNRCYGIGGSLLSEVLVRPAAEGQDSLFLSPFSNFAKLMLPDDCSFMMSKSGLEPFRIDPKLNEDLKKTYASDPKHRQFKYLLPNSTFVSDKKPSPFTKDIANKQTSPLEDGTFDRDDLWRNTLTSRRRGRAPDKSATKGGQPT